MRSLSDGLPSRARAFAPALVVVSSSGLFLAGLMSSRPWLMVVASATASACAGAACWRRGHRHEPWERQGRRGWRALAGAMLGLLLGVSTQALPRWDGVKDTLALVDHALMLLLLAVGLAALLPPTGRRPVRDGLDGGVVTVAVGTLAWLVVFPAGAPDLGPAPVTYAALATGVLAVSLGVVLLSRASAANSPPVTVLVPLTAGVVAATVGVLVPMPADWQEPGLPLLASLLVLAAAVVVPDGADALPRAGARTADRLAEIAPYAVIGPAFLAAISHALGGRQLTLWTASLTVALVGGWLTSSVVARLEAVAALRALESRLVAASLSRGARDSWFRSLVQNSSDVISVVDADGRIRFLTPSVAGAWDHQPTQLIGTNLGELLQPEDAAHLRTVLGDAARNPRSVTTIAFALRRGDRRWVHTESTVTSMVDDPSVRGLVLSTRDVSERRRAERELARQAYTDTLTGLANRALFRSRLLHALADAEGTAGAVAVMFLDLNGFKSVNDTLGHGAGDELLTHVARRVQGCVRPGDLFARLGGDEFAVLVPGPDAERSAVWVAGRVRRALDSPFMLRGGQQVSVGTSIGIAVTDDEPVTADDLLHRADVAMYHAKSNRQLGYACFDQAWQAASTGRAQPADELRQAISRGELRLVYLPVVDLRTGEAVSAEALVRWHHPERGVLLPDDFMPTAEDSGLVTEIGAWVLAEACRDARRWQQLDPGRRLGVALNVSRQEMDGTLVTAVETALASSGLPAESLTLEATEHVLMGADDAGLVMRELRALGVVLAVDDFGTGYSSLSHLAQVPVDILKIDCALVAELERDHGRQSDERAALVRTIIHLGRSLSMVVVAEGVETERQRATLVSLGCFLGQGHLFASPVPAAEMDVAVTRPGRGLPAEAG